jgi:hypothetical protein
VCIAGVVGGESRGIRWHGDDALIVITFDMVSNHVLVILENVSNGIES